jgi:quaternary ammonium compound-resistance protein SugE
MVSTLVVSPDEGDPYQASTTGRGGISMAWPILFVAGLLEVVWSLGLKYTQGFTRPVPSLITVGALVGSIGLLAQATRTLPIGTAYAVWVGIGTVGAALGGTVLFDEAMPPARVVFIALLVVSIIGLKMTTQP